MPKVTIKPAVKEESYIECDSCGHVCENGNFMNLFARWGYGSNLDLETWQAYVCEECVVNKLKPLINFMIDEHLALE